MLLNVEISELSLSELSLDELIDSQEEFDLDVIRNVLMECISTSDMKEAIEQFHENFSALLDQFIVSMVHADSERQLRFIISLFYNIHEDASNFLESARNKLDKINRARLCEILEGS